MKRLEVFLNVLLFTCAVIFAPALSAAQSDDYQLGAGDSIRINVFQNPDLTLETRVSETGSITYPLIGSVQIGGLSTGMAEQLIAQKLKTGNFVKQPQVNITLLEVRSNQVAVMGMVNKPGLFPMVAISMRLSEVIAQAGGVLAAAGTGKASVSGQRSGTPLRAEIDIAAMSQGIVQDILVRGGDVVYVMPGNLVSILGQVTRPGRYPLESNRMRLSEALGLAGGLGPEAADIAIVKGVRNGKGFSKEVDIPTLFQNDSYEGNIVMADGDEIYVQRAPLFYIYGEAQKPGSYRIERNMTVIQALAQGGGPTNRGTQRNIKLLRRNSNGVTEELSPKLTDPIRSDDVIYVRESLF